MNWHYKIDFKDESVFGEIEKERKITIPQELKDLIVEANAATPEKYNYMIGFTERVVGAILSFNKDEKEADSIYTALSAIEDKNLLPFAVDPFGNFICLSLSDNKVVLYDHETNEVSSTDKTIKEFVDSLY